jgi:tRNA(Ile)-lysidine synthase
MRMAHGSGLSGLRGMAAETLVEGVRLFRPLLGIAPEALRAVVDEAGLAPAQDPSNLDDDYERVRWRAMLPRLAELGLTPGRLGQFAARAGQADAALEHYAAMAMAEGVAIDRLGAVAIDRRWLLALPEAVGVRLLSKVMEFCGGGQRPRALGVVEAVYAALSGLDGGAGRTALGCLVRLKAETIWLVREPGRTALPEVQLAPGAELLWDQRFQIRNRSARRSLSIAPARHMTREGAERLLGHAVEAPSEAIRAAPLVSADDGTVLALGGHSLDAEVESVVQRPPN